MYNKRLQHKFLTKQALKDDEDPLIMEDVPSDDEWMVDQDVDMSQPSGSHQVVEKRKRNTNKGRALQRADGVNGWQDISNQVQFDPLEEESSDDDEENYTFDPHYRAPAFDTTDSLFDI
ncbi:hypothetical protein LWI29_012004 [Acer saccharum]|uniref:Uncharacterized protein n=1 Tax=Acer saccharum TaxID=4024 RepID=A0AA39S527_ACESA|nr:hypothetical protein LWI29_012004 [Acer saccharum]